MSKLKLAALPLLAACAAEESIPPHHNLSADVCLEKAKTSGEVAYIIREAPELINAINEEGCLDIKFAALASLQNPDFIYEYKGEIAYPDPERVYDYPVDLEPKDIKRETLVRICGLLTDEIKRGKDMNFTATSHNCEKSVSFAECVGSDDYICDDGYQNVLDPLPVHEYVYWEE